MNIQTALSQGAEILEREGVSAPRLTAEVLLCHALRCNRAHLYAHSSDELIERVWIHYGRYLSERLKGKPTQYITKSQEFYGREFLVTPDVLIPRPETEHLVEAAIAAIARCDYRHILDVGTGSGAIAISVALETDRFVSASDISTAALAVARQNCTRHGAKVGVFASDLAASIAPGSLDLLISNPPYVPGADAANMQREVREWEPHIALFADDSGLEIYSRLTTQSATAIRKGGQLMMELGYQSLDGVRQMLLADWKDVQVIHDLAGWPRVLIVTRA